VLLGLAAGPELRTGATAVSVAGLSAAESARLRALDTPSLAARLQVFTGPATPSSDQPAVAGSLRVTADGLEFRPLFPFVSGLRYTAYYRGEPPLQSSFEVPPPGGAAPRVVAFLPSGDALPENTLRLYVQFSQPMEARDVQRHVRLLDAAGRAVPLAFVEIPHGLWDGERTRLTLLFHPGRLKRGVAPGERMGAPLRAGGSYRLQVDAALRDAAGRPLERAALHAFRAIAADRASPRADGVVLHPPLTAAAPLVVDLPEPLDAALLQRLLWVEGATGEAVPGASGIDAGETRWTFTPAQPWAPGGYALRLHPALEDRAGNRFDRLFDRELAAGVSAEPGREAGDTSLRFGFDVGP
jgi:hypothetical protein